MVAREQLARQPGPYDLLRLRLQWETDRMKRRRTHAGPRRKRIRQRKRLPRSTTRPKSEQRPNPAATDFPRAATKTLFEDPILLHHLCGAVFRILELSGVQTDKPKPEDLKPPTGAATYPYKGYTGQGRTKEEAIGDLMLQMAGYVGVEIR